MTLFSTARLFGPGGRGEPLKPMDGRYAQWPAPLALPVEAGLNRARARRDQWLIFLLDSSVLPGALALTDAERDYLRALTRDFGAGTSAPGREFEASPADVKAVEYLIGDHLGRLRQKLGEAHLPSLRGVDPIFCASRTSTTWRTR